ncbi:MAG: hypothetical protein ABR611_13100 [Chthoniobacterales bacterium]
MAQPVLIKTITSMVLISIQPFAFRKIFLVIAALVCFSALCFADPVLMAEHYAPRAGLFETTTSLGMRSQWKSEDVFQGVDLPSRDQRLLPRWESTSEMLGQDDPGHIFQQTA